MDITKDFLLVTAKLAKGKKREILESKPIKIYLNPDLVSAVIDNKVYLKEDKLLMINDKFYVDIQIAKK